MLDKRVKVKEIRELGGRNHLLVLAAREQAALARPGQFVMLKCADSLDEEPLLRRPFSIFDARPRSTGGRGPGIEVLPAKEGTYATLRGGCQGQQPCSELVHYEWNGKAYARTWIDYKGHAVDVAAQGTLKTLTQDSAVYDAPGGKKAQALDEYPVGTSMLVIGTAREGPYTFVSPCNACRRGFVETALLTK